MKVLHLARQPYLFPAKTSKIVAKNLERFRVVTFDVTDTLLKFARPPASQYTKTAAELGYPHVNKDRINDAFKITFRSMLNDYPNFGRGSQLDWRDWWQNLVVKIFETAAPGMKRSDMLKIADTLIDQYATADCWTKLKQADQLVETVRNANKSVGIISNFDPRLKTVIERMQLPRFDFVLTSYEAGVVKPDPKIFEKALQLCSNKKMVKPNEALHIGNTPNLDYIGAVDAGWSSVLINDDPNAIRSKKINMNHVFDSLEDFKEKLENSIIKW